MRPSSPSAGRRAMCRSKPCTPRSRPAPARPTRPCSPMAIWRRPPSCRFPAVGAAAWIQYEFATPQTIRAITLVTRTLSRSTLLFTGIGVAEKTLEASDDGQTFRLVAKLSGGEAPGAYGLFLRLSRRNTSASPSSALRAPPLPAWAAGLDPLPWRDPRSAHSHRLRDRRVGAAPRRARQPL